LTPASLLATVYSSNPATITQLKANWVSSNFMCTNKTVHENQPTGIL